MTYGAQEGQLTVSIDLAEEEGSGAWCGLDFDPASLMVGQNIQPEWTRWPQWVYRLPDYRVAPIRQIQDALRSSPIFRMRDQQQGPNFKVLGGCVLIWSW